AAGQGRRNLVRGGQQHQVDDALEQADGSRVAVVAGAKAHAVDVGGDDIGRLVGGRGIQQEDLFKDRRAAQAADIQNEQGGQRGHDRRDGDMQALLELVGAVQTGGLVQFGVDTRHGGQVEDGAPADALPDAADNEDRREVLRQRDEGGGLAAHRFDQVVDGAVGRQQFADHTGDDNHRDEVGQVGDGLNDLLELGAADLVEQQREDQGQREADDQVLKVQQQGVAERTPEVLVRDELVE